METRGIGERKLDDAGVTRADQTMVQAKGSRRVQ